MRAARGDGLRSRIVTASTGADGGPLHSAGTLRNASDAPVVMFIVVAASSATEDDDELVISNVAHQIPEGARHVRSAGTIAATARQPERRQGLHATARHGSSAVQTALESDMCGIGTASSSSTDGPGGDGVGGAGEQVSLRSEARPTTVDEEFAPGGPYKHLWRSHAISEPVTMGGAQPLGRDGPRLEAGEARAPHRRVLGA